MNKPKKDKYQLTSDIFGLLGLLCLIASNLLKLTIGDTEPVIIIRLILTLAALKLIVIQYIYIIKSEKPEKSEKHI